MADTRDRNLPAPLAENGGTDTAIHAPVSPQPPTALASFDAPLESEGVAWGRYIAALRRYKWLILLITILSTAGAAVATRFIDPQYSVQATIWIETSPVIEGPFRPRELLKSRAWVELLKSGAVLDSVALNLRLYARPHSTKDYALFTNFGVSDHPRVGDYVLRVDDLGQQYSLEAVHSGVRTSGSIGDSLGVKFGFAWLPDPGELTPGRQVAFSIVSLREVSNDIQTRLTPQMVKDGNFLRLVLVGTDPERLPKVLNAITDQFISVAAEQKQMQLAVQASALRGQLEVTASNLAEAEMTLQEYRIKTITLPREVSAAPLAAGLQITQAPVMTNYFNQRIKLDQIEQDLAAIETTMSKIAVGELRTDALLVIPTVAASRDLSRALSDLSAGESNLRALEQRFTRAHRVVQDETARIARLREETIPEYVDGLIAQLQTQQTAMRAQIATASAELQRIPERSITEQRLEREKISAEVLFQTLQNNYEQTKLTLQSSIPDVRLLDRALTPRFPTSNKAPMIILMGFAVGLAAALALAILLDHVDKRFRYPEQVSDELGLTILGAVPAIKKLKTGQRAPKEASQVIEAFRTVRLSLAHSYGAAGPIIFTVSSPGPGDGKSLVSSNLALSFADAGYSTLLVDGDIRRGELHRMFDLDRQPGLLDYLTNDADFESILRRTQRGLSVIPCGTRRHLGPELLSSPAMGELMAHFKTQFDVIIMDSPPLGAGIDPFILGTTTGNMILVLRSGETDRKLAEEKLKLIDRLPIRMLGAILNDINTSEGAYRYYNYVYDYHPDDESVLALPAGANGDRS